MKLVNDIVDFLVRGDHVTLDALEFGRRELA